MGISKSFEKAIDVLRENSTENGFLASGTEKNNYKRVWSRDGVVQGIASLMSEDKYLIDVFKKNLLTLKKFQDKTGRIASNIDIKNKKISYGTLVGKIDATLWYVIGVGQYFKYTEDRDFLEEFRESIDCCVNYLYSLELNGKGLLFIPTGGDWADEYITQGYILFDQLLYLQALREYRYILKKTKRKTLSIDKKISLIEKLIEINYFPSKEKINNSFVYHKNLYKKIIKEYKKDYPLVYFSSSGFADILDSFACCLFLHLFPENQNKKQK
ncbi:MAG: glycoside hydrolase 100 family protein, partial [Minisyncoccales bacterium]